MNLADIALAAELSAKDKRIAELEASDAFWRAQYEDLFGSRKAERDALAKRVVELEAERDALAELVRDTCEWWDAAEKEIRDLYTIAYVRGFTTSWPKEKQTIRQIVERARAALEGK